MSDAAATGPTPPAADPDPGLAPTAPDAGVAGREAAAPAAGAAPAEATGRAPTAGPMKQPDPPGRSPRRGPSGRPVERTVTPRMKTGAQAVPTDPPPPSAAPAPPQPRGEGVAHLADLLDPPTAGRRWEAAWPTDRMLTGIGRRVEPRRPDPGRRRPPKGPRHPVFGMVALLVFAFAGAFFAWVSATPLALALGHGRAGVATVATCPVDGVRERCADFTAQDRSYTTRVRLAGPDSVDVVDGEQLAALMVSRSANVAYAGDRKGLYLGWIPGVLLVFLCGLGIVWATGALRLPGRRARGLAVLGSIGCPVLLLAGMLLATW